MKVGAIILMTLVLFMSRWTISRGRLWGSGFEDVPFDLDNDRDTARLEERCLGESQILLMSRFKCLTLIATLQDWKKEA